MEDAFAFYYLDMYTEGSPDDTTSLQLRPGRAYMIGKARDCQLIVKDSQSVSNLHVSFKVSKWGNGALIDLGSSNGTFITNTLNDTDVQLETRASKNVYVGQHVFRLGPKSTDRFVLRKQRDNAHYPRWNLPLIPTNELESNVVDIESSPRREPDVELIGDDSGAGAGAGATKRKSEPAFRQNGNGMGVWIFPLCG